MKTEEDFLKDKPALLKWFERLECEQMVMIVMQEYSDYVLSEKMPDIKEKANKFDDIEKFVDDIYEKESDYLYTIGKFVAKIIGYS